MKAQIYFRITSVLLAIFAVVQFGSVVFPNSSSTAAAQVFEIMGSVYFERNGLNRSYEDLYVGAIILIVMLYLFLASQAWYFGNLSSAEIEKSRPQIWIFLIVQILAVGISLKYFSRFVFGLSFLIAIFLGMASIFAKSSKSTDSSN